MSLQSDGEVLARIATGDVTALDLLYERYSRSAFSLAYRVLGNAESAEDVVQEAFLNIWRRADSYRPARGNVGAWLLSVVRHRAIDALRRRAVRPQGTPLDEVDALSATDHDPASEEALRRVEAATVRAAMESLTSGQRQVVELAFFVGLSYPEIAERTGTPLGTVKSRARLAVERLRQALLAPVLVA